MASAIGTVVQVDEETAKRIAAELMGARYNVEIATDRDGVRVKIDQGIWSPPMGQRVDG